MSSKDDISIYFTRIDEGLRAGIEAELARSGYQVISETRELWRTKVTYRKEGG